MKVFFDSHGKAWTPCSGEHPEARAFGPAGTSRELTTQELEALGLRSDDPGRFPGTPWSFASANDLVAEEDGWDWFNHPDPDYVASVLSAA
jgi:hypothetical protein